MFPLTYAAERHRDQAYMRAARFLSSGRLDNSKLCDKTPTKSRNEVIIFSLRWARRAEKGNQMQQREHSDSIERVDISKFQQCRTCYTPTYYITTEFSLPSEHIHLGCLAGRSGCAHGRT